FPVPEVLMALPRHERILKALCAYDVVGFQTGTDLKAFLRCLADFDKGARNRPAGANLREVSAAGRAFLAGHFPISIDTAEMEAAAARSSAAPQVAKLRRSLGGRHMLSGVDRMDYSKGLIKRLEAYHLLLQKYPAYVN